MQNIEEEKAKLIGKIRDLIAENTDLEEEINSLTKTNERRENFISQMKSYMEMFESIPKGTNIMKKINIMRMIFELSMDNLDFCTPSLKNTLLQKVNHIEEVMQKECPEKMHLIDFEIYRLNFPPTCAL